MQTLEHLRRRIDNANDMQSVVAAMKVLAVVSIRQFERSLESLSEYRRAIELGFQAVLLNRPRHIRLPAPAGDEGRSLCALVFGSEQGLSGQFNEQIVAFTAGELALPDDRRLTVIAMGEHVAYRLDAAGVPVKTSFAIPSAIRDVGRVTHDLLRHIDGLRREGAADEIALFYHKPLSGAAYEPHRRLLFPVDPLYLDELAHREWQSRSRPVIGLEWQELFGALVRQHLTATLESAFAESLLSENASRLFSMQVAEKNIADYLEGLGREFNNRRQGEITAELLDIVAGAETFFTEEDEYLEIVRGQPDN
ncbi:MAG: F0F1 ATP synthase subunit gamma [Thermoleophilia bacterium]